MLLHIGCTKPIPATTAGPAPRFAPPPGEAPVATTTARPVTTGATDLYFNVEPRELQMGQSPRMELTARGSFVAAPNEQVVAVLTKPDGTELKAELFLGPTESITYCLPTPGRPCEHDRRVEPFASTQLYFSVSSASVFDRVGQYRLDLESTRLSADTVRIVVTEGRAAALLLDGPIAGAHLVKPAVEKMWDPEGYAYTGVYGLPSNGKAGRVDVQVFEQAAAADCLERHRDELRPHQKRGLKTRSPLVAGTTHLGSTDRTSHFVAWVSGRFVVTLYTSRAEFLGEGSDPDAAMEAFIEAYVKRYPPRR